MLCVHLLCSLLLYCPLVIGFIFRISKVYSGKFQSLASTAISPEKDEHGYFQIVDSVRGTQQSFKEHVPQLSNLCNVVVPSRGICVDNGILVDQLVHLKSQKDSSELFANMLRNILSNKGDWTLLPRRELWVEVAQQSIQACSSDTLLSVLWSLAKIGAAWQHLQLDGDVCFSERISQLCTSCNTNGDEGSKGLTRMWASKVLWALGTLGAPPSCLSNIALNRLVLQSGLGIKSARSFDDDHCVMYTLNGLAKMGIDWSDLSQGAQDIVWGHVEAMSKKLERIAHDDGTTAGARKISSVLWVLGSISASAQTASSRAIVASLLENSVNKLYQCSARELCNVLW